MIRKYEVKYKVKDSGELVEIAMYGADFCRMWEQNSDILSLHSVEIISIVLQGR